MQVIGYIRVSTDEQQANGHGLDAQRAAIAAEAKRRRWEVMWVEEVGSGKDMRRRPKLEAALALLDARAADVLVVAKLDRLSRSVRDFADVVERSRRRGWSLVLLDLQLDTSTPMGEAMANMAVVFAQLERRMIGQRTKEGLAAARAKGKRLGSAPRTAPDVERRIQRERRDGAGLRAIAAGLNADAVPTALGGARWHASTVRSILQRIERDVERPVK